MRGLRVHGQCRTLCLTVPLVATIAALAVPSTAVADKFVDKGTGVGVACTQVAPCAEIQDGVSAAGAGETIHVDDTPTGTPYTAPVTLDGGKSIVLDDFVAADHTGSALLDTGGSTPITVSAAAGTIRGLTIHSTSNGIRVQAGVTITGNIFDPPVISASTDADVRVETGGNATVTGNTFLDPAPATGQNGIRVVGGTASVTGNQFGNTAGTMPLQEAVRVDGASAPLTISGNTVTGLNTATANGFGFNVQDASATITDNSISASGANTLGINVSDSGNPGAASAILRRNRVIGAEQGESFSDTSSATVFGDLIAKSGFTGLVAFDGGTGGSGDVTATNVTVFDTLAGGSHAEIQTIDAHVSLNSSIVGALGADKGISTGTCTISFSRGPSTGTPGDLTDCNDYQTTAAPGFVDTGAANNYHLLPTSPLIDMGDPAIPTAPENTDFDGDARGLSGTCPLAAGRRDIGADEFSPTCPAPPVTTPPVATPATPSTTTGQRAAALKKCKKKHRAARAKCKKKANLLPV